MSQATEQLTREQVLAMPAGDEVDALVSDRLFSFPSLGLAPCVLTDDGWFVDPERDAEYVVRRPVYLKGCNCASRDETVSRLNTRRGRERFKNEKVLGHSDSCLEIIPRYSADVAAAFDVVDAIYAKDYGKVRIDLSHYHGIHVWMDHGNDIAKPVGSDVFVVNMDELPLAICRAALLTTI